MCADAILSFKGIQVSVVLLVEEAAKWDVKSEMKIASAHFRWPGLWFLFSSGFHIPSFRPF